MELYLITKLLLFGNQSKMPYMNKFRMFNSKNRFQTQPNSNFQLTLFMQRRLASKSQDNFMLISRIFQNNSLDFKSVKFCRSVQFILLQVCFVLLYFIVLVFILFLKAKRGKYDEIFIRYAKISKNTKMK